MGQELKGNLCEGGLGVYKAVSGLLGPLRAQELSKTEGYMIPMTGDQREVVPIVDVDEPHLVPARRPLKRVRIPSEAGGSKRTRLR